MTLKELRNKASLTIREFAELIGVSRQTVCNYERDICRPSPKIWSKIAEVLELSGEEANQDYYFRSRRPVRRYSENSICSVEGCNNKPTSLGMCTNHYVSSYRKKRRQAVNVLNFTDLK